MHSACWHHFCDSRRLTSEVPAPGPWRHIQRAAPPPQRKPPGIERAAGRRACERVRGERVRLKLLAETRCCFTSSLRYVGRFFKTASCQKGSGWRRSPGARFLFLTCPKSPTSGHKGTVKRHFQTFYRRVLGAEMTSTDATNFKMAFIRFTVRSCGSKVAFLGRCLWHFWCWTSSLRKPWVGAQLYGNKRQMYGYLPNIIKCQTSSPARI